MVLTEDGLKSPIFMNSPKEFSVWSSHGDEVISLPPEFEILARYKCCGGIAAFQKKGTNIFGLAFHPEVD